MKKNAKIRKSRKRKSPTDKAMAELAKLCRLVVLKRDGRCILKYLVPLKNGCSDVRQADHMIPVSIGNVLTRFELRNLNELCSSHNMLKQMNPLCTVELARWVDKQYGDGTYEDIKEMSRRRDTEAMKPNLERIESKIAECKEFLGEL